MKLLIDKNADVNSKDKFDSTPLHLASGYNPNEELVKFLLENNANVNAKDKDGWTPLHLASSYNQNEKII